MANCTLYKGVSLSLYQNSWIQLNVCPVYYARCVKNWLNRQYSQRWTGRGGPISWPSRSLDLTSLDFYLWGTLKEKVYSTEVRTRDELITKINIACEEIRQNRNQLKSTINSITRRYQICVNKGGYRFEIEI
ncbi:hypothetical protein WN51_05523 [Melipona quadrifasciata]|uniref:Uncharacterized protein n=1 Tax=Melipona quadrifasciata TaxID=166423 RepID=A0A0M8ZSI7_9HYME|nr:hypothetical protein WN51_05523 [Melipona quadrifasciata]